MVPRTTPWLNTKKRRRSVVTLAAVYVAIIIVVALCARWIAPYDPNDIGFDFQAPPSKTYWLGTDLVGRDLFSRLVFGARVSLTVGFLSVGLYTLIGVSLSLAATLTIPAVDQIISRLADLMLSFPPLILILVAVAFYGSGLVNIIIVLTLLGWPSVFRLVRAKLLSLRESPMVEAARGLGASTVYIARRYMLPNVLGIVLVAFTFGVGQAILTEAALSFLGLGVQPPTPSWGNMLSDAQSMTILEQMPWMWLPPGIVVFATVIAINIIGDALRDYFDPKAVM